MTATKIFLPVLTALACLFAMTATVHGRKPDAQKSRITVQGTIGYNESFGGYFVNQDPVGRLFIVNKNPDVLKKLMEGKQKVTIEGYLTVGADHLFIEKINGRKYDGRQSLSEDKKISSCKYCGMDREKFARSRMLIEYSDGTFVGTCSLHCVAVDLALNIDKTPKSIMVGDYAGGALIDSEKAAWVLGGSKMGVMTRNAKWAFAQQEDAVKFIKENGGKLATYDEAMKSAYEDMYADTKMIREKRKMRMTQQNRH